MRKIEDYEVDVKDREDYILYINNHDYISPDEYKSKGLCNTMCQYDYEKMSFDFWEDGIYASKMDLFRSIMNFGKGKFIPGILLENIEHVISNIDKYKEKYRA